MSIKNISSSEVVSKLKEIHHLQQPSQILTPEINFAFVVVISICFSMFDVTIIMFFSDGENHGNGRIVQRGDRQAKREERRRGSSGLYLQKSVLKFIYYLTIVFRQIVSLEFCHDSPVVLCSPVVCNLLIICFE